METKAIMVAAFNAAITSFQERGGKMCSGDVVIDYNRDNIKVAPFCDRHPGWIEVYVTLKEGTGLFFIKSETTMYGNIYYVAWEEDNSCVNPWKAAWPILKIAYGEENKHKVFKLLWRELDYIVSRGLSL